MTAQTGDAGVTRDQMPDESFREDEDWETGSEGPHVLSTDSEWSDSQSDVKLYIALLPIGLPPFSKLN